MKLKTRFRRHTRSYKNRTKVADYAICLLGEKDIPKIKDSMKLPDNERRMNILENMEILISN